MDFLIPRESIRNWTTAGCCAGAIVAACYIEGTALLGVAALLAAYGLSWPLAWIFCKVIP